MQANNQMLGSPVNRIRIMGNWASRSLVRNHNLSFRQRVRESLNYVGFLFVMFSIDVAFWTSKFRQWIRRMLGKESDSFEDQIERSMRGFAKDNFGVEIADDVFQG